MKNKEIIIGSHVSMKAPDYLLGSVKEAISYNANAFMIYNGPPQSSKRSPLSELKINEAWSLMQSFNLSKENIIVHAPYIINLSSIDESKRAFGIDFLINEINRSNSIGAKYIVLHPGSAVKTTPKIAIMNLQKSLNEVLKKTHNVIVCLETMAGKGNEIGKNFYELKSILNGIMQKDRVGICFDTCHVSDAGYDLSNLENVLCEFNKYISIKKIKLVHLNDSLNPIGSKKDRHANIGKGSIGINSLVNIIKHKNFANIPFILETPYVDKLPPYKKEIELLFSFL
ncbi:deoxyribonuclease IV [Mycoplasmoides alvi]|uniref:deoxyribonuclease IV n=1 Tax=Mycoplasmoides alvi TaxID=78580 RepID=UPI00051B4B08|nr:deoxyribonuclease IV [Mycoplasmoides alvi]